MDFFVKKWLPKFSIIAFVLTLALISLAGVTVGMAMENGMMAGCPLGGMVSLCTMGPLEHISQWQSFFSASVPSTAFWLVLLAASVLLIKLKEKLTNLNLLSQQIPRLQFKDSANAKVYSYLLLAFSDGILHPKIF